MFLYWVFLSACLFFWGAGSHYVALTRLELFYVDQAYLTLTERYLPVSATSVLELKLCVTIPGLVFIFEILCISVCGYVHV